MNLVRESHRTSRHQVEILHKCAEEQAIGNLMEIEGRSDRNKFRDQVLRPLLDAGLVEMTIPDKPTSSKQKYRLTEKGKTDFESGCLNENFSNWLCFWSRVCG